MDKRALREKYKTLRAALGENELEDLSLAISNNALQLPIWDATNYHIFLPIAGKAEVNTEYLLHILQGKDKTTIVPKAHFKTGEMTHILLQENTVLKLTGHGIPEPENGIEVTPQIIEVVFVPLLAYDKKGNRVGYGKGFYDRFLSACKPSCIFVGLSFFEPENMIEKSKFDIPLHYVITPSKNYTISEL
ncbi:5-formyltetrahydrofolate cyclo-ligase [Patiriisocius marinistellae]|uniref:5-formyltetrahydrofolate cyclo-ligase n=1 Tax=Patiriisocius marinistellae TaxID=2494560 RepID=A0A5J4FYI1_9FLAO|nr:5-formyltetrahydrofolate cyclo-ligase [Patiriisocius marinistellae]GEQ84731.1 5-formyltetrahydrofolate cyclo-ligase [Patiriisocius marinistellae]